ncbi:MAG: MATE family efflux transporter [Lachnospiraceae bacterium]|nr:MATE family efflux transporter [Lachnospiraceae bacterium]
MGTGIIKDIKKIIVVAFPLMVQGIVFQLQSLTDKAFLGNLDTKYVAAIGSAQGPLISIADSLIAISMGLTIIVSRLYGAEQFDELKEKVRSSLFYSSLLGMLVFLLWQFGAYPVLAFFQVSSETIGYAATYIRICSWFMLLIGIDSTLQSYLQGIGNTKPIMYAGVMKVIVNIVLSWILIFGKLGFPALYVRGAAIGTLIANVLSTVYLLFYCMVFKKKEYALVVPSREWLDARSYQEILKLGIPCGLEYFLWNFSNLILIRFINGFSYQSMAIYSITFGCQCMVYAVFAATSRGTLVLIGHDIGAGKRKDANKKFYACVMLNALIVSIAAGCFMIMPQSLLGLFSNDAEIIRQGVPYLIFLGIIMFPQSMNTLCGNGIKAKGDSKWMLISQIYGSAIVISVSTVLIKLFHMDMMAVYITLFLDEGFRGFINYRHYRKME